MCGFVGIVGRVTENDIKWVNNAVALLKHRGPDYGAVWVSPNSNAAVGHRRLSIIDTGPESDQPFFSRDGDLVLLFNGEIYNYIELREELERAGEVFHTKGDTEVLLAAYRVWGVDCVKKFNGMFAFSLLDKRNGVGNEILFIGRDRAGEKPLYYFHNHKRFEFASELKGLKFSKKISPQGLNHYLSLGFVPGALCIAEGLKKLQAGHCGIYNLGSGQFHEWEYWRLPSCVESDEVDGVQLANEAWSLLKQSVKMRLRSDVECGVFLSGGLDSSLVTAAAAEVSSTPIKTFTIGLPGSSIDETKHAEVVANFFGTDHHVLNIESPSLGVLSEFAHLIDEPIADSSIIPTFLVSKMTRGHVKVALGGDGGDELFGGYEYYQTVLNDMRRLGWMPQPLMQAAASLAVKLPAGVVGRNRLGALLYGPRSSRIWGTPFFDKTLRKRILSRDFLSQIVGGLDAPEQRGVQEFALTSDVTEGLLRFDFKQQLSDSYLVKVDRASMANGLEVRTPFLDHQLVEFAYANIPSEWKCNTKERRRIQNLMAARHLPESFKLHRKQGFSVPMDNWMRSADFDLLFDCLPTEIFNHKFIKALISGQMKGRKNGARLFSLFMLTHSLNSMG